MASQNRSWRPRRVASWLVPALVTGSIAGAGMGALLHLQLFILPLFGYFYGWPTVIGGAILHMVASLAFAGAFTYVVTATRVRRYVASSPRLVGFGVVYGVGLWLLAFGVGLPLLTQVTAAQSLSIPYLPVDGLVAHLVYGLLLGGTLAVAAKPVPRD